MVVVAAPEMLLLWSAYDVTAGQMRLLPAVVEHVNDAVCAFEQNCRGESGALLHVLRDDNASQPKKDSAVSVKLSTVSGRAVPDVVEPVLPGASHAERTDNVGTALVYDVVSF